MFIPRLGSSTLTSPALAVHDQKNSGTRRACPFLADVVLLKQATLAWGCPFGLPECTLELHYSLSLFLHLLWCQACTAVWRFFLPLCSSQKILCTTNPMFCSFFFKPYFNISFSGDLNRYKAILWWVSILVMCMNRETLSSQKMSLIQASAKGRLTGHLDSTVLTFIWFFLWDNVSLLLSPLHITQLPKVMQKSNFYTRLTAFSWLPLNI